MLPQLLCMPAMKWNKEGLMKKLGIYIHIPFCVKKCNYCDFYSIALNDESEDKFTEAILNEIRSCTSTVNRNCTADTIFFGGGTPSIIKPENLGKIIEALREIAEIDRDCEITMEANPNTLTEDKLKQYKDIGINRLSIGVQSLNDEILKKIGRIHCASEALEAIDRAKNAGFENINADVMFNIPGQNIHIIEDTLCKIIQKGVKHISFYSLKLEEGTPMYAMEKSNKIIMPEEEYERKMYYAGRNVMEKNNLYQYEISNFAQRGFECRHNLKYWNQEEYIGFGPSSHSFLNNIRYSNPSDLKLYCEESSSEDFKRTIQERLSREDLMFEYIMLRLRLTEGIDITVFNNKFSADFRKLYSGQIEYLLKNSLIETEGDNIRLTLKGMDLSNYVIREFMN